jgi:hypothetical protein
LKRLAALLLGCYPPAFRERFGDELAQLLDDLLDDTLGRDGASRPGRAARICADLLKGAAAEWWASVARPAVAGAPEAPGWPRLRGASPQRTAVPPQPPFTPLPSLRRRHGGGLAPRAPTMR